MSRLLAHEKAFWQQRSKVYWLRDGDTNSRFFHAMASSKRRRNYILEIQNKGAMINTQQGICEVAMNISRICSQMTGGKICQIWIMLRMLLPLRTMLRFK